jgi:translation initiation factor 1
MPYKPMPLTTNFFDNRRYIYGENLPIAACWRPDFKDFNLWNFKMSNETRLVYSTETGRIKRTKVSKENIMSDGVVKIKLEVKGRKGKGVTTISGLNASNTQLKSLTRQLKKLFGTGGSLKNGIIEIQGDRREGLRENLKELGHVIT